MAGGSKKLEGINRRLEELASKTVTVGVHYDAGKYDDGMSVAQVAIINSFGSLDGKIPPRPFMSIAKKESEKSIKEKMIEAAKVASNGGDGAAAFKLAGESLENSAKGVIDSVYSLTPNAPSTISKKGKNHPLYDTGRLRNSIKTKVK